MSQESSAEGYSEPNDVWEIGSGDISINEQQITSGKKGKISAFGHNVISSGRAEWDLQIDFESFGGITIGIYKHSRLTSKNDLTELPINDNFAKKENGYGYTNKTGAVIHNNERKKYGNRFRAKETLTMSVDLLAGTLSYAINGVSQGTAYEIPRGAYRLACCLPFKEQQVSIKRFWTSLPRATDKSDNAENESKNDKNKTNKNKKNEKKKYDSESNENKTNSAANDDPDNNPTGPDFDFGKDTQNQSPTPQESHEIKRNLKKMGKQSSSGQDDKDTDKDKDTNITTIGGGIGRARKQSLAEESKKDGSSSKALEPITVPVKDDEESSDYFYVSGHNLSTEKPQIVACIRQEKGVPHSAFGAQLVTHGRTEWILKIISGHRIIIGVCGTTQHSDGLFTDYEYGFGYGDDGNIYMNGGYIEYNNGYKSGDTVGVHLDMDVGEVRFSVNGIDQGPAFEGFKPSSNKSSNESENEIDGYRLAVSLQFRPHSVELKESTSWSTNRVSPRPGNNTQQWSFSVPHQRKLSWNLEKLNTNNNGNSSKHNSNGSNGSNTSEDSKSNDNDEYDKSTTDNNGNSSKGGKNNEKGNLSVSINDNGKNRNNKNGKRTKSVKNIHDQNNGGSRKRPKSARKAPKSPKMKNSHSTGNLTKDDQHTLKPSNYGKNGSNDSNINWQLRNGSTDIFERSGSKLDVSANKNSVSAKNDIKDGNSAIGKLTVSQNMKVEWEIKIDQGSRVTVGIINMDRKSQTAMRKLLNSFFTNDLYGYGYFGNDGGIARNGRFKRYGEAYKRGDTVSVVLDLFNKTLSFNKNGEEQGVAFKNIPVGEYRVAIAIPRNRHKITLTKVQIWDAIQPNKSKLLAIDNSGIMSSSA